MNEETRLMLKYLDWIAWNIPADNKIQSERRSSLQEETDRQLNPPIDNSNRDKIDRALEDVKGSKQ